LFPEEIVLVKPVFTFIQNPKIKENLIFLLLLSVFLYLIISPGAAASSNWEITPENPVVGDTMEIKGTGFEGDTAKVMVTFEKEVQVEDGEYEYLLEDVVIPSGFDNSFTVKATGADNINVRAKMLLWITKSAEAKDGTATVSQSNVPPGTYKIRIDGKASSDSKVKLKITAMQNVKVESGGSLNYEYNTESIPAGNFEVEVGGVKKQIELQPEESSGTSTSTEKKQNLTEENSSFSTEQNLTEESYDKQNLSEDKNNKNLADTVQKEKRKSSGSSHRSGLKLITENPTGTDISSIEKKDSYFMEIKPILEAPKTFLAEEVKPYVQARALTEIIRNPPKVPSFLLGFAGTLLIGLAILRKKR
jgi:hypothetical protein